LEVASKKKGGKIRSESFRKEEKFGSKKSDCTKADVSKKNAGCGGMRKRRGRRLGLIAPRGKEGEW